MTLHAMTDLLIGSHAQSKYVVLNKSDIKKRQDEVIEEVTSVLGISAEDAARILRKYKW